MGVIVLQHCRYETPQSDVRLGGNRTARLQTGLLIDWLWDGHGRPWVRHGLGVGHGMAKWVGYVLSLLSSSHSSAKNQASCLAVVCLLQNQAAMPASSSSAQDYYAGASTTPGVLLPAATQTDVRIATWNVGMADANACSTWRDRSGLSPKVNRTPPQTKKKK